MTAWLIGVTGIIVVGVIIELLLTDSAISKFVRSIYAFFILLVIVSPLPNLFRNGAEVGGWIDYDREILTQINAMSLAAAQQRIERELQNAGFDGVLVMLTQCRDSPTFRIDQVFVNAWNVRPPPSRPNINVRTEIIRIVTLVLNVDEGRIVYHD